MKTSAYGLHQVVQEEYNKAVKKWFITWNRPEYKEWATKTSGGYLLLIIRQEQKRFLCVKAELIMGEKGLPDFKVIEEHYYPIKQKATEQINDWR